MPLILKSAETDDDELREHVIQTLEALVLKCPTEVSPFILEIVEIGTTSIKYDPVRSLPPFAARSLTWYRTTPVGQTTTSPKTSRWEPLQTRRRTTTLGTSESRP